MTSDDWLTAKTAAVALSMPPDMDYALLRQKSIHYLESMTDGVWTDFNAHDPGITILEQYCYALTDLAYRIDYDIKDLLADGQADPYRSLYSPAEVLTTHPVTLSDLRKILIDTNGVANAWVEPVDNPQPALYHDTGDSNLYLEDATHREAVVLRGLYRVLIAADHSLPDTDLARLADQRLQACRNIGQEFLPARVLAEQQIVVAATIEIDTGGDADRVLAGIQQALSCFISPRIRFYTLSEMVARGRRMDEIMEGPVLKQGFIDTGELEIFDRKNSLHVSDLIQEIMAVTGVCAIDSISISTGGSGPESWYLTLDQDSTPVLDVDKSSIKLLRGGAITQPDAGRVKSILTGLRQAGPLASLPEAERDIRLQPGRDRQTWRYHSIQHQFPAVYGIGMSGLPAAATDQRHAQARQLQAYLLFIDQLLANSFAQLSHSNALFSFDLPDTLPRTYFSQTIDDPRLGLDGLWVDPDSREDNLQRITESPDVAIERKNRFLNHLLARYAEDFTAFSQSSAPTEAEIKAKTAFLRDYRQLGTNRALAFNCSLPAKDAGNVSGLEKRISRKLGLSIRDRRKLAELPADGEGGFHMLEHILLRPRRADQTAAQHELEAGGWQAGVLLSLPPNDQIPPVKDPYSQQISFIFPDWISSFGQEGCSDRIRQLLRDETPAHLHIRQLWLDQKAMRAFEADYQNWLDNLGGLNLDTGNTQVRDARDRLIDWLGMGTPYPLRDVELQYDSVVALDNPAEIHIPDAQGGVRYSLCNEDGDQISDTHGKPLSVLYEPGQTATAAILPLPAIVKDISFTILASREFDVRGSELKPPLEIYLQKSVSIKAGINSALAVEFRPAAGQTGVGGRITINYAETVALAVKASQAGISYELVMLSGGKEISLSKSAPGNRNDILLVSSVDHSFEEDTEIKVKAYRTLAVTDFVYLNKALSIWVRPNPKVAVSAAPSIIDYDKQTTLTLANAQSSVSYQLFKRDLAASDYPPVPNGDPEVVVGIADKNNKTALIPVGSFGSLSADTGVLLEDTLFFVKATKNDNQESLWLDSAVAILVRPNSSPAAGAKALKVATNTAGTITVSGTQKGVMYQLRLNAGNLPVNSPGYHWEDRGVATTRVGIDLIVGAPNQPEDYKTLLLPTNKLTAETKFNVLATKRQTGLDAQLAATVTIGIDK